MAKLELRVCVLLWESRTEISARRRLLLTVSSRFSWKQRTLSCQELGSDRQRMRSIHPVEVFLHALLNHLRIFARHNLHPVHEQVQVLRGTLCEILAALTDAANGLGYLISRARVVLSPV